MESAKELAFRIYNEWGNDHSPIIARYENMIAERDAEWKTLIVEYQMALANAEALVLSHEGTIEKRDREIEQLQKWQDDAFCHVETSRNYLYSVLQTMVDGVVVDQLKQLKDEADRLIAEVQEE